MASRRTYIQIANRTPVTISLGVRNIDNYDWDGNSRPDHNLQGKTIRPYSSLMEREEVNSFARGSYYNLVLKLPNGESTDLRLDQQWAYKDNKLNKTQMLSSNYEVLIYTREHCYPKISGWNPVLHVFVKEKVRKLKDSLNFFVISDLHIDSIANSNAENMKKTITGFSDYLNYDYILMPGDLTKNANTGEDVEIERLWMQNNTAPIVCEGYGNHDICFNFGNNADVVKLINERNNERAKLNIMDSFSVCSNNRHYYWKHSLKGITAHFFMLNLYPGRGNPADKVPYNSGEKRDYECYWSLEFLENRLKRVPKNEPVFLLHHYGHTKINQSNFAYWTDEQRRKYYDVIKEHRIAGLFTGHVHTNELVEFTLPNNKKVQDFCCGGSKDYNEFVYVNASVSGSELNIKVSAYSVSNNSTRTLKEYTV